jgi:hypothetical protein
LDRITRGPIRLQHIPQRNAGRINWRRGYTGGNSKDDTEDGPGQPGKQDDAPYRACLRNQLGHLERKRNQAFIQIYLRIMNTKNSEHPKKGSATYSNHARMHILEIHSQTSGENAVSETMGESVHSSDLSTSERMVGLSTVIRNLRW